MKNKQALKKLAIKSSALALSMSYFLGSVAALPTIEFDNVNDSERDVISMTDERQFEATLLLEGKSKAEVQQLAKGAKWSLYRLAGSQSEYFFPYQYLGGDIVEVEEGRYGFREREKWDRISPDPLVGEIIYKHPYGLFCTVKLPHATVSPFYHQIRKAMLNK